MFSSPFPPAYHHFFFNPDRKLLLLSPLCQLCDAGDRVTSGLDVLTWLPDNGTVTFETISNPTLSSFVIFNLILFFYNTFHPICSECKATLGADVQTGIIDFKLTHQLIDDKKFQLSTAFAKTGGKFDNNKKKQRNRF